MKCLIKKEFEFEKERQIVSMHIRSNKTHLSNVVFASIRFPKFN